MDVIEFHYLLQRSHVRLGSNTIADYEDPQTPTLWWGREEKQHYSHLVKYTEFYSKESP